MKVANPIYDIVFKYMMEDERIARTILSALLEEISYAINKDLDTVTRLAKG